MIDGLPQYVSHKLVRGFKIDGFERIRIGVTLLEGCGPNGDRHSVVVDDSYIMKHSPRLGGYYVIYQDGYESWSPAEAFENGYTLVETPA